MHYSYFKIDQQMFEMESQCIYMYVDIHSGIIRGGCYFFISNQLDEILLTVHIIIGLVDESYFGNKKSQVKFIWVIPSIPIKCN